MQAAAAAHAAAHAGMPAVEDGRQIVLGNHFVERPGHAVLRVEALHRRVELETLDAVFLDQLARLARTHPALVRVDAGEGDHHVAVLRRGFGDFLVGDAPVADMRLGIDGEHHQADLALAVIGDGFVYGRPMRVLEILVGSALVGLKPRVLGLAAGNLGVGVGVDGDQFVEIHDASAGPSAQARKFVEHLLPASPATRGR
jgi:hypothetical protein